MGGGGHRKFRRNVLLLPEDDDTNGGELTVETQRFTMAATPSDHRAVLNALADLRRQDGGVVEV
jgi:hypothetical protein